MGKSRKQDCFFAEHVANKRREGKDTLEAWHGYKPSLQNIIIYSCLCISHIPQVKRDKLDKTLNLRSLFIIVQSLKLIDFLASYRKNYGKHTCIFTWRMRNGIGKKLPEEYHKKSSRLK